MKRDDTRAPQDDGCAAPNASNNGCSEKPETNDNLQSVPAVGGQIAESSSSARTGDPAQSESRNGSVPTQGESPSYRRPMGIFTPRQQRGLELALAGAVKSIEAGIAEVHNGDRITLPNLERDECTCNQYRKMTPRIPCECLWAARYTAEPPTLEEIEALRLLIKGELLKMDAAISMHLVPLGSPKVDQAAIDAAKERLVRGGYKRFSAEYDRHLRADFLDELRFVIRLFQEVETTYTWRRLKKRGRKPVPLHMMLFAAYVYTVLGKSTRFTEKFLMLLAELGFLNKDIVPAFDTLSVFLRSEELTPLVHAIMSLTAEPFRELGPWTLAADGTGSASNRNRFFDYRSQRTEGKKQTRPGRPWYRVLIIACVDTLHTVAFRVEGPRSSEKTMLKGMIDQLQWCDYDVEQFLLDGGFNATMIRDEIIEKLHALPLCPWAKTSKNAIPKKWRNVVKNSKIITELHRLCTKEPEKFKQAGYRYRVKIECLFAAVKEKFNPYVRTTEGNGPENEIGFKFIAQNISMLLLAARIYDLDIESLFAEPEQDEAA
jgi:hypothetical protein